MDSGSLTRARRCRRGSAAPRTRDERGAQLVEFVFASMVLLLLIFGVIELTKAWYDKQSMTQGVREAARQGIVANYDGGIAECSSLGPGDALACQAVQRIGLCGVSASVTSIGAEIGSPLTIEASLPGYKAMTGFFSPFITGQTLEGSVTMRIENYPDPSSPIAVNGSYSASCSS